MVHLDGVVLGYVVLDHESVDVVPDILSDSTVYLKRLVLCRVA